MAESEREREPHKFVSSNSSVTMSSYSFVEFEIETYHVGTIDMYLRTHTHTLTLAHDMCVAENVDRHMV